MEALAAFSIACNVIQTVDFGLKTCSKFNEIRKSGSLKAHDDIGKVSATLEALTQLLSRDLQKATPLDPKDQALCEVVAQCLDISLELQELLNSLKPVTKAGAIVKVIQTLLKTSRITELQERLREQWQVLQGGLLIDLSDRVRKMSMLQIDQIAGVDAKVQILVEELGKTSISGSVLDLESVAKRLAAEGLETRQHIDEQAARIRKYSSEEHQETRKKLRKIEDGMETQFARLHSSSGAEVNKKVLQSLAFPEMGNRQEQIRDAHGDTYKWIFESNSTEMKWSDFKEWLETSRGIYWINGKAGSGKSTLMNYIWQSRNTTEALRIWSPSITFVTPAFFFWRPGTEIQRTCQGLLRALLYQILGHDQQLANVLIAQNGAKACDLVQSGREVLWSETQLISGLKTVVRASSARYCFFIDGLDEYEGDRNKLLNLMLDLAERDGVKMCVSSRPSRIFEIRFEGMPSLRLQDLTNKDIQFYVDDNFAKDPSMLTLAVEHSEDIALLKEGIRKKADGVFLWVCLVVRDILTAYDDGHDLEELFPRLEALPSELDELFTSMIGRIVRYDRPEAALYFSTMIAMARLEDKAHMLVPFALATWDRLRQSDGRTLFSITVTEAGKRCESTVKRLTAMTAGLLETVNLYTYDTPAPQAPVQPSTFPPFTTGTPPKDLVNWRMEIVFLHRTVFDYLMESSLPEWLQNAVAHQSSVCLGLSKAHLLFVIWSRTIYGVQAPGHAAMSLEVCLNVVRHTDSHDVESIHPELLEAFGRKFEETATAFDFRDHASIPKIHSSEGMYKTCVVDVNGFAAAQCLRSYMSEKLKNTSLDARTELASYFLLCVLGSPKCFRGIFRHGAPVAEIVEELVARCDADVNRQFKFQWCSDVLWVGKCRTHPRARSAWETMLINHVVPKSRSNTPNLFSVLDRLVRSGADLQAHVKSDLWLRIPYRDDAGDIVAVCTFATLAFTPGCLLRCMPGTPEIASDVQQRIKQAPEHWKICDISLVETQTASSVDPARTHHVSEDESECICAALKENASTQDLVVVVFQLADSLEYDLTEGGLVDRLRRAMAPFLCRQDPSRFRIEDFEHFAAIDVDDKYEEPTPPWAVCYDKDELDFGDTGDQALPGADPHSDQ